MKRGEGEATTEDGAAPGHWDRDLRGVGKLAIDATTSITSLVEAMHRGIVRPFSGDHDAGVGGISGLVYGSVRGITRGVGLGVDAALKLLAPALRGVPDVRGRDSVQSIVNGVMGDYLRRSGNPLALDMQWRVNGQVLTMEPSSIMRAFGQPGGRLLIMVHGLCMNDLRWQREVEGGTHDHGLALQRDLGFTPVYLRYNTGLHVSTNGQLLAQALATLAAAWPVPIESISIVAHSMGGLVARSACDQAERLGAPWRASLRRMVFIGTPHTGAPLERGGRWIEVVLGSTPYAAPLARLGRLRSDGITDLRYGSVSDADWQHGEHVEANVHPLPLPPDIACYAIAGTIGRDGADLKGRLLGDGLVPLASALGRHRSARRSLAFPPERTAVFAETGHLALLGSPGVYGALRGFMSE
ncbi:MAG: alpha/beta hydrolase [Burkholderiales bacterium]|nr:alpha/beta hydrolase [Burkholderiales bacterium]